MKFITPVVLASIVGIHAFAQTPATKIEKWHGQGLGFDALGQQTESYKLALQNTETSVRSIHSAATIESSDGSQMRVEQDIEINKAGWDVKSSLGNGHGLCFGKDFCENYITGANGLAYSTIIVKDGPTRRREITTILQNGRMVKTLTENLVRD